MKIEKFKEQQRELFEQFGGSGEPKKPQKLFGGEKRFFLSVSRDTLLLALILSLMAALLFYATGVEIGRHRQKMLPVAEKKEAPPQPVVKQPIPAVVPVSPKPKTAPQPVLSGAYTIQVISYRQTGPAERTLGNLKKRGIPAFVVTGPGGAVAVCVGSFAKASEAQQQLKELKQLYPDCFLRKK